MHGHTKYICVFYFPCCRQSRCGTCQRNHQLQMAITTSSVRIFWWHCSLSLSASHVSQQHLHSLAERVLLINRSTKSPAGPLPSLHLLSSAPIDIYVTSYMENYHTLQSHLFYIWFCSSLTFCPSHTDDVILSFTCFNFLCHPPICFLSLLLLHSRLQGAGVYPSCLGAKLRSELSHSGHFVARSHRDQQLCTQFRVWQ